MNTMVKNDPCPECKGTGEISVVGYRDLAPVEKVEEPVVNEPAKKSNWLKLFKEDSIIARIGVILVCACGASIPWVISVFGIKHQWWDNNLPLALTLTYCLYAFGCFIVGCIMSSESKTLSLRKISIFTSWFPITIPLLVVVGLIILVYCAISQAYGWIKTGRCDFLDD